MSRRQAIGFGVGAVQCGDPVRWHSFFYLRVVPFSEIVRPGGKLRGSFGCSICNLISFDAGMRFNFVYVGVQPHSSMVCHVARDFFDEIVQPVARGLGLIGWAKCSSVPKIFVMTSMLPRWRCQWGSRNR